MELAINAVNFQVFVILRYQIQTCKSAEPGGVVTHGAWKNGFEYDIISVLCITVASGMKAAGILHAVFGSYNLQIHAPNRTS